MKKIVFQYALLSGGMSTLFRRYVCAGNWFNKVYFFRLQASKSTRMASLLFSASAIPTVLLCIIAGAFCCNLIYTCHEGNFLVVNNLNSVSFDSATASMSSNGTACTTRMSADQNYITITDCGLVS